VPIIFYYDGMLAKRAQLVFYTAWEMANRNDMLKRDIPLDAPRGF
jgi:hypothetical protein